MISNVWDSPLFLLLSTLCAYLVGLSLYRRCHQHPLCQPILIGILIMIALLFAVDVPFERYNDQVSILNLLLGTATVALAIPIYENFALIRHHLTPILVGVCLSGILSSGIAVGLAWMLGATPKILLSIAPKSITTPFAIGVSEAIGGYPSLSAAMVILTGILVAVTAAPLARWAGVSSPMIIGLTMGMTGHGIATARAFEISPQAGAFSALGMGMMGLYISTLLPYFILFFG